MIINTLISRDSKGKIRQLNFKLEKTEQDTYIIHRESGLLGGTFIKQPDLEINKGKVKRTIKQQAELEYNSLIKKALDKGYKNIQDLGIAILTEETANLALPKTNTDQNDIKKPMLCKVLDKTNIKMNTVESAADSNEEFVK